MIYFSKKFLALFFLIFLLWAGQVRADTDGVSVTLEVALTCNSNGICEAGSETANSCPADCASNNANSSGGAFLTPQIISVSVNPGLHKAFLSWQTNLSAATVFSWGKTTDFELGKISESEQKSAHQMMLESLEANELYYFKVEIIDSLGLWARSTGQFVTLDYPLATVPNVSDLVVVPVEEKQLDIEWHNPSENNFSGVIVVRSEYFYPTDPYGGKIIYEGSANKVTDTGIEKNKTYFYSVFVKNKLGDFSSGALGSGKITTKEVKPQDGVKESEDFVLPAEKGSPLPLDLQLFQNGKKVYPIDGRISIDGNQNFKASIVFSQEIKAVRTVIFEIGKAGLPFRSFLLRQSESGGPFEGLIGQFQKDGEYTFRIRALNGSREVVGEVRGILIVDKKPIEKHSNFVEKLLPFVKKVVDKNIIALVLFVLIVVGVCVRTLRREND